jgi:hypothetical protein
MFEIGYWVAEGEPGPDIPWPTDWEVCGVPSLDPVSLSPNPKREGANTLAWPMYNISDPMRSLADGCTFLDWTLFAECQEYRARCTRCWAKALMPVKIAGWIKWGKRTKSGVFVNG